MGHHVQAFIGTKISVDQIHRKFGKSKIIELSQGLSLLPVTNDFYDAIPFQEVTQPHKGFMFLDKKIVERLIPISRGDCVGYIETDYFGRLGDQGAVFAKAGKVVFGPRRGKDSINTLPRLLGVKIDSAHDEFEAIGLGKFRSNEDWLTQRSFGLRS